MKKHLLFLCFIPLLGAATLPAHAADDASTTETEPMLVVHHYYGNDSYPVKLTDYNRINIGQGDNYTLVSNTADKPDITLSSKTYPRFSVKAMPKDVVTSQEQVADGIAGSTLIYCAATQSLKATSPDADFTVAVFNASGQQLLSGRVGSDRELSVASLPSGIYIAATTDKTSNFTLKFAKH